MAARALLQWAAAAGERVLLQAAAPAPSAAGGAAPAPAPDNATAAAANDTGTGYQVSFGSSSCANITGPICYNTAISGENLITGMWVNVLLGLLCYAGFVLFRAKRGFEFYHARLLLPAVSRKPPQLQLHGHQRFWGWLLPVFKVTDEELVRTAGLDALIAVRILSFGVILFLPMTVLSLAVLLPVNFTSDYYKQSAEQDDIADEYTSIFMRMTISNIQQGSPKLWIHFIFCYMNMAWTAWLIVEYYKEYIALRQTYLVRCTTVPGEGGSPSKDSSGDTPLLTPSVGGAARSPMKRGLAVAQPASPTRRSSGGGSGSASALLKAAAAGGGAATAALAPLGSIGRAMNRLKLPRRNASRANDEFGEFAFRPSRFSSPSASPPEGSSPSHAPREVAGQGSIFSFAGPSRFSHSRNPSKGSPPGPAGGGLCGAAGAGASASPVGVLIAADGTTAAVQGLAAALAVLPPGSPVVRETSSTPGPGGIELSDLGSGAGPGAGSRPGTAEWEAGEASSASTPASEGGPARARRPLLQEQALRSTDRLPDSAERKQQQQQQHFWQRRSSDGIPAAVEGAADPGLPPKPPGSQQQQQQQQQGEQQQGQQQQGEAASIGDVDRSLSFAAGMRSLSLNDGRPSEASEDEEQADTASSPPRRPSSAGAAASGPAGMAPPDSVAPSSHGSAACLLPLGQQTTSSQGVERSGGSGVALLPMGAAGSSSSGLLEALPARHHHRASNSFEVASALGFDQTPPDPEEIYAAIVSKSAAAAAAAAGGAPAVGRKPGKAAGAGAGGEGESGAVEGISTQWWKSAQLEDGAAPAKGELPQVPRRMLHPNQSITFKGAVRLAPRRPGPRSDKNVLHANASLFTCLVMDMPLEQLKLRRIGVFPVMWRSIQLEPSRSLGHASTLGAALSMGGGGGGGGAAALSAGGDHHPPSQEDISAALDELEAGLQGGHSQLDEIDAHAMGIKSMLSRLRALWKHRSRYAEWRRDVRWAMYNKRVRIATEMFSELFGPDFDSIIPIYPTASVDKLAHKWDAKLAVLERLQLALQETPRHQARRVARLKARVQQISKEVADLQNDIAAERDAVLSDLPSTCFFATFRSQQAAAIASQTNLNPIMQRLFTVLPAPRPDDVNWPALQRSWWQRTMRPLYALPIILFFMLLPIGMFTGAFAQLTIALCGSPQDPGSRSDAWYCSDDRWATFFRNMLTSLAPSIILSVYHMVFLPVMVYYAAQMEGQHVSLSALDRRCADLFFYWDVFNIFLGALFGGTVLAELKTFLTNPSQIWRALGSAIPAASNFFINYVMYRAFVMSAFRLFYPHQAIMSSILKWIRIVPKAKTPRDKLLEVPPRNCRYGRDIGIPVLMNFVMVCSMSVTSPLILPFGLLYFAGLWAVWRYQALYVYQRQYESGGQFWPLVAHKVVGCQLIMAIFTASVLMFKGGYTQAALLYVTGPIFLLRFDNYITKRYDDLVRQVPLMAVHTAGRSNVPAEIYTPPPLRSGGAGWHPEWGKVWQWWGIGRYTV